jgi:hypothetical protein
MVQSNPASLSRFRCGRSFRVVNSIARVKAVDTADGAIDALKDLDKRWVVAAGKLIEGVDENPLTLKRA